MGLTGFFKRVETRMFPRVQTSWFQHVFHDLLKEERGSGFPKKQQWIVRKMTPNTISAKQIGNPFLMMFIFVW